tara:strand:- start:642 stop:1277 length:636 start_codon:yes stop_codon:yes gene_type:complete
MFINKDDLRRLANKKASRPIMGQGIPAPNEGIDGDFRLNNTPTGVKLYAKFAGQWFAFSPDNIAGTLKTQKLVLYHSSDWINSNMNILNLNTTGGTGGLSSTALSVSEEDAAIIAPANGRVQSMMVRSESAGGSTIARCHKISNGTQAERSTSEVLTDTFGTVTQTMDKWSTSAFTFDAANFNSGDLLFFSLDPTNNMDETQVTIILEVEI